MKQEKLSPESAAGLKAVYETLLENVTSSKQREENQLLNAKELKNKLKVCARGAATGLRMLSRHTHC